MALTTCQDCGHELSTRATRCPHCGRHKTHFGLILFIGLIVFILAMLAMQLQH